MHIQRTAATNDITAPAAAIIDINSNIPTAAITFPTAAIIQSYRRSVTADVTIVIGIIKCELQIAATAVTGPACLIF